MRSLMESIQIFAEVDERLRALERRARQDPSLWSAVRHQKVQAGLRPDRLTHLGRIWSKAAERHNNAEVQHSFAMDYPHRDRNMDRMYDAQRAFIQAADAAYPPEPHESGKAHEPEEAHTKRLFAILKHLQPHPGVSRDTHLEVMGDFLRRHDNQGAPSWRNLAHHNWQSYAHVVGHQYVSWTDRPMRQGPEPVKVAMRKAIHYHYPDAQTHFSSERSLMYPDTYENHTLNVKFPKGAH